MLGGFIEPLYIIYSGIEDHSQFFCQCVSAQGLFLILNSSPSYLKHRYFPIAFCGRHDRHLTRQCRRGALLPAMNHCSPLRCLHPGLSETWRACLVFEQNCWTVSSNALLSYPAVMYYFWFLLGWFASKLRLHVCVLQWHAKRRAEICLSGYMFGKTKPILLSCHYSHSLASPSPKLGYKKKKAGLQPVLLELTRKTQWKLAVQGP